MQPMRLIMLKELLGLNDKIDRKSRAHTSLFLGNYTPEDLYSLFSRFGILEGLHKAGFTYITIHTESVEDTEHILRIVSGDNPDLVLVYLKIREGEISFPFSQKDPDASITTLSLLIVDWLTLQNPLSHIKKEHLLPGQEYSGLNLLSNMHQFILEMGQSLEKDAIMNIPEYYHVAVYYSSKFYFINPEEQAKLLAIKEQTQSLDLRKISWAIHTECLLNKKNKEVEIWDPSEMLEPLSTLAKNYFGGEEYRKSVKQYQKALKFKVDTKKLKQKIKALSQ